MERLYTLLSSFFFLLKCRGGELTPGGDTGLDRAARADPQIK